MTFGGYFIDTENYREDTNEQSNPPSNDEFINQLANIRRPQREIFTPHIFDPRTGPASKWRSDMVEIMNNVVTEDKTTQGGFQ